MANNQPANDNYLIQQVNVLESAKAKTLGKHNVTGL
jgi:hypothetical protein